MICHPTLYDNVLYYNTMHYAILYYTELLTALCTIPMLHMRKLLGWLRLGWLEIP